MKKALMSLAVLSAFLTVGCSDTERAGGANSVKDPTAGGYPSRTIEVVVPYAAGGGTDILARGLVGVMQEYLPNGQNMIVVNRPGGAGTIGMTEVYQAAADGYKVGLTTNTPISIMPLLGDTVYTSDDFIPVARLATHPQFFLVRADSPWNTFEEWLDYMRESGNDFTYATSGSGSSPHIAMEALNLDLDISAMDVAFDGAAPAITALMGGHVDGAAVPVNNISEQDFRALVGFGSERSQHFAEVPTLRELDVDIAADLYTGVYLPLGTPDEIVDILSEAFERAMNDPKLAGTLENIRANNAYAGPEAFSLLLSEDVKFNRGAIQRTGMND